MSTVQLPYFSRIQNGSKTLQNLSNCFPYLFPCFTIATHDKLNRTLKLKTVKLIRAKQIGHWQSRWTLAGKYLSFMWVADLSTDFWWKFICYCSVRKLLVWYCRNETNSVAKLFSRDSLQLNNFLFHNPKYFALVKFLLVVVYLANCKGNTESLALISSIQAYNLIRGALQDDSCWFLQAAYCRIICIR